ncbi:MAG: Holliday junction resolvase RuvX [Candidatus Binataceae bacterium]
MTIAALDYGKRRIGLAIGSVAGLATYHLATLERRSLAHDLEVLRARFVEYEVTRVVVGLPLNMDGSAGPQARAAETFAAKLRAATGLAVELYDERLSSFEAEERLKTMPMKRVNRKRMVDAVAAAVILEGWLQSELLG